MIYTTKEKNWVDEQGLSIPYNRITKTEKIKEKMLGETLKKAKELNKRIADFKELVKERSNSVFEMVMQENDINLSNHKGNFTIFSFDRSVKVEVRIAERIDFDDLTIKAAQNKFMQFVDANVSSKTEFVKEMIRDAFTTQRGKLEAKKILSLLKYKNKINDPLFSEATDLIQDSIRRPDSKVHFRIWEQDENGEYKAIDLNFSSI